MAIIRRRHRFNMKPQVTAHEDQPIDQRWRSQVGRNVPGPTSELQVAVFALARMACLFAFSLLFGAPRRMPAVAHSVIPCLSGRQGITKVIDITQQTTYQQEKSGTQDHRHADIATQPWCPHPDLTVQCYHPRNPDRAGSFSILPAVWFLYSTSSGILNRT